MACHRTAIFSDWDFLFHPRHAQSWLRVFLKRLWGYLDVQIRSSLAGDADYFQGKGRNRERKREFCHEESNSTGNVIARAVYIKHVRPGTHHQMNHEERLKLWGSPFNSLLPLLRGRSKHASLRKSHVCGTEWWCITNPKELFMFSRGIFFVRS